jgi:hypothetical protein
VLLGAPDQGASQGPARSNTKLGGDQSNIIVQNHMININDKETIQAHDRPGNTCLNVQPLPTVHNNDKIELKSTSRLSKHHKDQQQKRRSSTPAVLSLNQRMAPTDAPPASAPAGLACGRRVLSISPPPLPGSLVLQVFLEQTYPIRQEHYPLPKESFIYCLITSVLYRDRNWFAYRARKGDNYG